MLAHAPRPEDLRVPAALRPAAAPWAVRPAIWALLAAVLVVGAGVVTGNSVAVGLAYFGVACAADFVTSDGYRVRLTTLLCQGLGAGFGIVLGVAVADSVVAKLAVAAAVAMLSGMVGTLGRSMTAGALMAVIGVAFGEFARVAMPGWEQGVWYLVGTLVVAVFALGAWPVYRDRAAWSAVAAVFDRAADVMQEPDGAVRAAHRVALGAASAASRIEVFDHRLGDRYRVRDAGRRLIDATEAAEQAGFAAAALFASGQVAPGADIDGLRRAAIECRARRAVRTLPASCSVPGPDIGSFARPVPPVSSRLRAALGTITSGPAVLAGLRLAVCMTVATAVACVIHTESHSFWLPLTVAVAVRPEYSSVFVRTVNRLAGTVVGALVAAGALAVLGSGWPVAIAVAVSLSLAVLAGPKLYGLSVVGVTCSALLSSCIAVADPISPAVRVLDTLLGCAIAIVFGCLLWPRRLAAPALLTETADAISTYLELAGTPLADRRDWIAVRDRAYHLAHRSSQDAQAALLDPEPIRGDASETLARARSLEVLVDEVTAISQLIDSGSARAVDQEMSELSDRVQAAAGCPSGRRRSARPHLTRPVSTPLRGRWQTPGIISRRARAGIRPGGPGPGVTTLIRRDPTARLTGPH